MTDVHRCVVIVGGGFAGTTAAIRLLASAAPPLRILLVEPRLEVGRGLAYATPEAEHYVNGPAKAFSIFPERPTHFADWLAAHDGRWGWHRPAGTAPDLAFVPRWLFGTYVRATLEATLARTRRGIHFEHILDTVTDLEATATGLQIRLANAPELAADHVILALGAPQSRPAIDGIDALAEHPAWIADPWNIDRYAVLRGAGRVAIIGAGLTALDAVVSAERQGFRGEYVMVSRHGLGVHERHDVTAEESPFSDGPLPTTALGLHRAVVARLRRLRADGGDWQRLVLAVRQHVPALWDAAPQAEKARFLRHLRRFWDVSLHRAPPPSAALRDRLLAEGRLRILGGRVNALAARNDGGLDATIVPRGRGASWVLPAQAVVNATGPDLDWRRNAPPLVENLLRRGLAVPGPLGIGLGAAATGALIGADGITSCRLSAIGPALRGGRWESTTLPEIAVSAAALAERLSRSAQPAASAA